MSGSSPAGGTVIEARALGKDFGEVTAVREVSFAVGKGEIFGFFGPNGAGKSTSIRLLCGLTAPSRGGATVLSLDVAAEPTMVRRSLGIVPEEAAFYEKMTVTGYLEFFAAMAGVRRESVKDRMAQAVKVAQVSGFLAKRIKDLSHGQRQRVSLARCLLSEVPVLFLDEPFQGIDIVHRKALREYLRGYVKAGNTVFFTSHNLIEAEHVVDRFAFIDKGALVTMGAARDLREKFLLPSYAIRTSDPAKAHAVLAGGLAATECVLRGEEVHLTLKDAKDVPKVSALLGAAGIAVLEMRQLGTMEDVFLRARAKGGKKA